MTENKRFIIILEDDGYWIRDESDFKIIATGLKLGVALNLRAYLNRLHEENQMLKEQNGDYYDEANSLTVKIAELSEENEKLKHDIGNLKLTIEARETLIDVCEKKFKELGYIITVDDDGYVIE